MKRIAVLLTVYNRREKTLKCLRNLFCQKAPTDFSLDVYLTNDGCTDGTPDAVRDEFPQVHIIDGDGSLFWNRGMYTAWSEAEKGDYDYYLWLNDDTYFVDTESLTKILDISSKYEDAIIVGSIRAINSLTPTYGGINKSKLVQPKGKELRCDTFNGNCVLIPKNVYLALGKNDYTYRHALGDLDYGWRATRHKIPIYVTGDFVGFCDQNKQRPMWCRPEVPFCKRIKNLYSPLAYAEPGPFFHFNLTHFGLITALRNIISQHIRVLFPAIWMK